MKLINRKLYKNGGMKWKFLGIPIFTVRIDHKIGKKYFRVFLFNTFRIYKECMNEEERRSCVQTDSDDNIKILMQLMAMEKIQAQKNNTYRK